MDETNGMLTVFFDEPFWVGVFEVTDRGRLKAAKITFGAEPKDSEILEFVLRHYPELRFSPAVATVADTKVHNPKRMQREARRQTSAKGIGTKAMQAVKLQQEQNKLERKVQSREQKEAEKERQFELKQRKRTEKHRGH